MQAMNHISLKSKLFTLLLVLSMTSFLSCNAFEQFDGAETSEELIQHAQALMDSGDCVGAEHQLLRIDPQTDQTYNLLGWAQLCSAGASFEKIGVSLFSYSSTSSNSYAILGSLANAILPQTATKEDKILEAIANFEKMDTSTARSVYVAIGHLVHAVSVIGQAATNDSNSAAVSRDDISASACANQTCTSAPASCTAGISDEDAIVVATAIAAASSTLGGDSTFSTISSLTSDLGGLVSTVAPLITRCTIYNELFTN